MNSEIEKQIAALFLNLSEYENKVCKQHHLYFIILISI